MLPLKEHAYMTMTKAPKCRRLPLWIVFLGAVLLEHLFFTSSRLASQSPLMREISDLVMDHNGGSDWMLGRTKSLVAIQLAESKTWHYEAFVQTSWKRLSFDPQTSKVVADLFIACHPEACHVLDESCREIQHNVTLEIFTSRQENELLCFYAAVPEKQNEPYQFAHSLHFLEMEPFLSILNTDFYDYILRSDADAMLLPGLLQVPPTGDGWIGSGYYGMDITNHLLRIYVHRFLPELGPPLRPNETTPSMQSTFYVHKNKFRGFVSVLIKATKTLFEKAFTKQICNEILQLPISKELHPEEDNLCQWAFWHQGVSSLYGTRVAVDYVLENVTVTTALDALATELDRQNVSTTIQVHLLGLKYVVHKAFGKRDSSLCTHPIDTVRQLRDAAGNRYEIFFHDMEEVYRDRSMTEKDIVHYTADVVLDHFHRLACREEDA